MAKVDINNLRQALTENNEKLKQYVYDVITHFSPTSANIARILSHMANTTIHISREDRELWDSSFERAKEYMDTSFKEMTTLDLKTVQSLPTENISSSSIYLLETNAENVYDQYVYSDGKWVFLGSTSVDMSSYYTKNQIDEIVNVINSTSKHTHANIDILEMITAPYTAEEKNILKQMGDINFEALVAHLVNNNVHITDVERQVLSSIRNTDLTQLLEHSSNSSVHVTQEEKEKYDRMLQLAKAFVVESLRKTIQVELVEALPDVSDAVNYTLYLVPAAIQTTDTQNVFDKWLFIGGAYEKWGGSGGQPAGSLGPDDLADFLTYDAMKQYVDENLHVHNNLNLLQATTASFTTELLQKIQNDSNTLFNHINNGNIHVTENQQTLLNRLAEFGDFGNYINEKISEQSHMKILYVDVLPRTYGDIDKMAIYFVLKDDAGRRPSNKDEDGNDIIITDTTSIAEALKNTNYDKYIWDDTYKGWEKFGSGDSLNIKYVNQLPTEREDIKSGVLYFVPNGLTEIDHGELDPGTGEYENPIGKIGYYSKYIWNDVMEAWEIIYEDLVLSDDDISYILGN